MKKDIIIIIIFVFSFCFGLSIHAQEKMAITITPPLIKNNIEPGQIWKSYLKVVNNNAKDIDVYVELMNFESGNETGTVKLTPLEQSVIEANEYLINNWIHIDKGPIKVSAYKSVNIPFIVDVPERADPGDHHVAILIGTKAPMDKDSGSSIKISSMLGSLLLLNVDGEIKDSGVVREFSSDKDIYDKGEVNFKLRFQNTGNTILQPQGEIRIYNWQEKDQGSILVNHKVGTGNIFPDDTRLWQYSWNTPKSVLQMGRYRANMFLTYGGKNKETVERNIYFWVIHWQPLLIVFGSLFCFILLIIWLVRRSIHQAILRTQEQLSEIQNQSQSTTKPIRDVRGVVDLKKSVKNKINKIN